MQGYIHLQHFPTDSNVEILERIWRNSGEKLPDFRFDQSTSYLPRERRRDHRASALLRCYSHSFGVDCLDMLNQMMRHLMLL